MRRRAFGSLPEQLTATEFKARCLEVMDLVLWSKCSVVVTKRGKPVVEISPARRPRKWTSEGCMIGRGRIVGDITGPTMTPEETMRWEQKIDRIAEGFAGYTGLGLEDVRPKARKPRGARKNRGHRGAGPAPRHR